MTENSGSPSESFKGFKVTVAQGIIGAISLAGTTAIPLLVNRYLAPPTPAESSAPAAQVAPAPAAQASSAPAATAASPVAQPAQVAPAQTVQMGTMVPQAVQLEEAGKKGKKKKHD